MLWRVSTLERVRKCGRALRVAEGVTVRLTDGIAGMAGLCTCGSVWSCPVCGARIAQRRALEIAAAVAAARVLGLELAMLTFTMRHDRGQALDLLWDGLRSAWDGVISGKVWKAEKSRLGVLGWLRVVEVTWGVNGWHVHVHALVVLRGGVDGLAVNELGEAMARRWFAALKRRGLDALPIGQDFRLIEDDHGNEALASYLAKAAGFEMAYSQGKGARGPHSTDAVWTLLDEFDATGDRAVLDRWQEYEQASSGRRQLTWSRTLRADLGLDVVEQTDDEIAAEELGTADDGLVLIIPDGWIALVRRPALIPRVYEIIEKAGQSGLSEFLRAHGIAHVLV